MTARMPKLQLTRSGLRCRLAARDIASLHDAFAREHHIRFERFIEPRLLAAIQNQIDRSTFNTQRREGVFRIFDTEENPAAGAINVLLNDPALFRAAERIADCGPIGSFNGGIRRLSSGPGIELSWHADTILSRTLAMTINLGREPYRGGILQIREVSSGTIVAEVSNATPGDAIVFRVGAGFEHRNTDIEGDSAKTFHSGWFQQRPEFRDLLARRLRKRARGGATQKTIGAEPSLDRRFTVPSDIVHRTLDGETTILSLATGACYGLEGPGARIWDLISKSTSPRAIAARIAREYRVTPEEARGDVTAILASLAAAGLVHPL